MKKRSGFLLVLLIGITAPMCRIANHRQDLQEPLQNAKNNHEHLRFGNVIKLKPEKYDFYKELHASPWPGVDSLLKVYHIRNYSIFCRDGYLFSYMEYAGDNWEDDMENLGNEPLIKDWWKLTDPCQIPVESAAEGEWWAPMEELYHLE